MQDSVVAIQLACHAELEGLHGLDGCIECVDHALGDREVAQGRKHGPRQGREEVVELELSGEHEAGRADG